MIYRCLMGMLGLMAGNAYGDEQDVDKILTALAPSSEKRIIEQTNQKAEQMQAVLSQLVTIRNSLASSQTKLQSQMTLYTQLKSQITSLTQQLDQQDAKTLQVEYAALGNKFQEKLAQLTEAVNQIYPAIDQVKASWKKDVTDLNNRIAKLEAQCYDKT